MSSRPSTKDKIFDDVLKLFLPKKPGLISVQEAYESREDYIFIDAREESEFEVSHIRGSIHVGCLKFDRDCLETFDPSSKYIVYCSIGWRSYKIGLIMQQAGFANVKNLYGGIFEWINMGHEVVLDNKIVRQVHAYSKKWGVWVNCPTKIY